MIPSVRWLAAGCVCSGSLLFSQVAAQSATMTIPGMGQMLAGDNSARALKCNGDAVTVSGSGNKLTLTGNCTQVVVNGSKNVVTVVAVGQIVINGRQNTVTWSKSLKGVKPMTRITGTANKILKK
ncbi:DUF3060 domain-containing protein [Deinococcus sp. Arct2-2]|uniref:DUF3060 domain-containing protein n=1 Tax=Deinococcus sp. Arct2-2 TaxID=2568653 RepID=UPI0010A2F2D7|nr:DUF3060 domain-containing protein [Deinococcus sp. Arct2-2]THF71731.1 DUF3060 domain-containing protein [Deinococcus sp. Arct2-2]